jgi:hypothetical protein
VGGRRRRLPRRAERQEGRWTENNRRNRLDDGERHRRGEDCRGWTRFMALGMGAAIVCGRLGDPRPGRVVFVMVQRTRAVLAALPPRFGRRLPASALRDRALGEREHAHDRRHPPQERTHVVRMRRTPLAVNFRRLNRPRSTGADGAPADYQRCGWMYWRMMSSIAWRSESVQAARARRF